MLQKQPTNYTLLLLAFVFIIAALCSCTFQTNAERHYQSDISDIQLDTLDSFKDGDILYPDYACPDTLIVMNGVELDKVFRTTSLPIVGSDSEIDSVLHRYCLNFNQYVKHKIGLGYRKDIALHLALVEFKRIAPDTLYQSIIED